MLVDRGQTRPALEGIYLLRADRMLMLKRLQATGTGRVRATSDNPAYAPLEFSLDELGREVHVIGRVVRLLKRA